MRRQVVFKIGPGVPQRHTVLLEQGVHLDPRLQSKQTPNLPFRQSASAIGVDRKRFECLPRQIGPVTLERGRDVIRQSSVTCMAITF